MPIDIRILFSGDVYNWINSWTKIISIINVTLDKSNSSAVYLSTTTFVILASKVSKNFEEH